MLEILTIAFATKLNAVIFGSVFAVFWYALGNILGLKYYS